MKVEEALETYFKKLINTVKEKGNDFPLTIWDEDIDSKIFVGEMDEDEWIHWQPLKKENITNFNKLEEKLNFNIHADIFDYFNSYWFCELGGNVNDHVVQLDPVLPGVELLEFSEKLNGYKQAHNGLKYIPIGMETKQGLIVVINNNTGCVKLEDYEIGKYYDLADNLPELINNIYIL